jgi:transcriptional repressor NrdR
MRCPNCKRPDSRVTNSRTGAEGSSIRRRRECPACGHRFTTFERIERTLPMIVKKDGRREPFDRGKVLEGIKKACQKRPVATEDIDDAVARLEDELTERGEHEVAASVIGEWVMEFLKRTDDVAYVRFASVYRSFKDVNEFMQEVTNIIRTKRSIPHKV